MGLLFNYVNISYLSPDDLSVVSKCRAELIKDFSLEGKLVIRPVGHVAPIEIKINRDRFKYLGRKEYELNIIENV